MRRSSCEPLKVGEPDLDERPDRVLEPGFPRRRERLLVALSRLRRIDPLLEAIVACDEELLDARAGVVPLHKSTVTSQIAKRGLVEAAVDIPERIRVLIADDHRVFAEALEAILATDDRISVSGHASDGAEAVQLVLSTDPDVTLMDIAMPVMDGFQATKQIRGAAAAGLHPHADRVEPSIDVDRAREAGAAGYVTKDRIAAELIDAILEVVGR